MNKTIKNLIKNKQLVEVYVNDTDNYAGIITDIDDKFITVVCERLIKDNVSKNIEQKITSIIPVRKIDVIIQRKNTFTDNDYVWNGRCLPTIPPYR